MMERAREHANVPIAVIGMACRMPGADNLDAFWQLLVDGRSAVGELPPDRFDQELYYDPRRGVPGKSYTKMAALMSPRPPDRRGSTLPDRLAAVVDGPHLSMCEVAAEACRHAGLDPFDLPLRNTGVYIGHARGSTLAGDYTYTVCIEEAAQFLRETEAFKRLPAARQEEVIREAVESVRRERPRGDVERRDFSTEMIAGTISKAFGLTGPFTAINAACASSLECILMAARSLQLGRIEMAIVGGASLYKPDTLVVFSLAQSMSPSGTRPFDAEADGLIVGEGFGAAVLKTLPQALADGDRIWAVIRGLGVSSDGRGKSLWAPRKEGQIKAIRRAYASGLEMSRLGYIEAHATSTPLGDATELNAMAEVLRDHIPPTAKIPVGSVKANIGHALEAAGIAGFLKAVLSMQHGLVPPAINVRTLNPNIDWDQAPFYVPTSPTPWPAPADGDARRAAVNAFGIGGLNMHIVLDEFAESASSSVAAPSARPKAKKTAAQIRREQSVAVIGMGCIFPGAGNVAALGDLLASGRDPKCQAPPDRWRADLAYRPGARQAYRTPTTLGGFITGFSYDWRSHKIPPRQVAGADPLQFMLLDAADQALKDSGYDTKAFRKVRARTGVIVGTVSGDDFTAQLQMGLRLPDFKRTLAQVLAEHGVHEDQIGEIAEQFGDALLKHWPALVDETGSFSTSTLASRITKTLDLMGGGAALDSGATSAVTALGVAVDLLLAGDCDLMFCAAGGRRMGLQIYEALARGGLLATGASPRSPLDAQAAGFVPGEGVGVLLLKRLSDAERDGDRIRAVIRGVGAAHEASPSTSQRMAIERSLDISGVQSADVGVMEVDCVGAAEADAPLLEAVAAEYGRWERRQPLLLSSLVGQLGYTEGVSGMASLLAAILAIERGEMPATVGLESPATTIVRNASVLNAVTDRSRITLCDGERRRLAAVLTSSKNLSYQVVVESATKVPAEATPSSAPPTPPTLSEPVPRSDWRVIRLGAATRPDLLARLAEVDGGAKSLFLAAEGGRFAAADRVRLAIVADTPATLSRKIAEARSRLADPAARLPLEQEGIFCIEPGPRRPRIAFLFPGQGSQYAGMLRELVRDVPAAAARLREIDAVMADHEYPGFAEMAWPDDGPMKPAVWTNQASVLAADTIFDAALADLGIHPDVVSGHSYGEYPALIAAGAWDFQQALEATRARSRAIEADSTTAGAMLAVAAPPDVVERLAAKIAGNVYVANHNAPDQTVVAGRREALSELKDVLSAESLGARVLPVPAPFHSPLMEAATGGLRRALYAARLRPPRVPVLSSVTNRYVAEPDEIRANLVAQLITPLWYVDLIRRLVTEDDTILVEVGPKQVLTQLHRRILSTPNAPAIACDNPKRPGVEQLFHVQAFLEAAGALEREPIEGGASTVRSGAAALAPARPEGEILHFDATERRKEKMREKAEGRRVDRPRPAAVSPAQDEAEAPPPVSPHVCPSERSEESQQTIPAKANAGEILRRAQDDTSPHDSSPGATGVSPVLPSATPPSQPAGPGSDPAELESFLVNFVVEQTGYPPEVVELDADLEADLGIDSIKKAQMFGELQEYFDVTPSDDLSLDDFPTLRHVVDFLKEAPTKGELPDATATSPGAAGVSPVRPSAMPDQQEESSTGTMSAPPTTPILPEATPAPTAETALRRAELEGRDARHGFEERPGFGALNLTVLRGSPYEMGQQHGLAHREAIRGMLRRYADLTGPALENLPDLSQAPLDAGALFGPEELEEFQGIADAVEAPLENVLAHNLYQFFDVGCAQFAVTQGRNPRGGMIHAANEDLPLALDLRDCLARVVQVRHPKVGAAHLTFSLAGTVGGINGINAHGLAVTGCMLLDRPQRVSLARGRLHFAVVKRVLQFAVDTESALEILFKTPRAGAWGLLISHHPSDRLCYVEYDGQSFEARDNDDAVAATNHSLLLAPSAGVPEHSGHRLKSLEGLVSLRTDQDIASADVQSALRSRYDVARGRDTDHPTMNTLCRVDNQISIVMEPGRGKVWVTAGPTADEDPNRFHLLEVDELLPRPASSEPVTRRPLARSEVPKVTAEPSGTGRVAHRFVMRMVEAPLEKTTVPGAAEMPDWHGRALLVGSNPTAEALSGLLEASGVDVREVPLLDDVDETLAAVDRICSEGPVRYLLLMTGRDVERTNPYDEAAWERRLHRAVFLPYFISQRWIQLVGEASSQKLIDECTIVAATTLGGDFGFSGDATMPESGALTGLVKGIFVEFYAMRKHRGLKVKIIDAPLDEPPDSLAADICRELAAGTLDYEVAYVRGERRLQTAVPQNAAIEEKADIRPGETWVVTGGARGITAECLLEFGRRYRPKLHLIGTSPAPQIEPAWRDLSDEGTKTLKASIVEQARREGFSQEVPAEAWKRVEKAIEIDRTLRAFQAAGIEATYHVCDVSDRSALDRVLEKVRRTDGPIEGILHAAGIDNSCRFERKDRELSQATIAAKIVGASNLMALCCRDPVRHFIGFGSVSGRLGGNGQVDYSLASDMLAKLIDWYQAERPSCRATCFHWSAWDEVGMAMRPAVRLTLQMAKRRLIPKREGVEHFLREVAAGLPENEVMLAGWQYYEDFYGRKAASETSPSPRKERRHRRHVLRMCDARLPDEVSFAAPIDGPVFLLGDNPSAQALDERLAGTGIDVHRLPVHDSAAATIAGLERLWVSHRAKHLFLLTARDEDASDVSDRHAWQRRRGRGMILPYLVAQRWLQLASELPDRAGMSLVAVTALGGDFGFSGNATAPEGGMLAGLLKSLYIEDSRKKQSELRVKVIDAPAEEMPDTLAEAICREIVARSPEIEVGWSGGKRRVVRPVLQPVDQLPRGELARGGAWVVTGGGRGVTAAVALQLGRRYGWKLHLIGKSPAPREDAVWRHYSEDEVEKLKGAIARKAIAEGRTPSADWAEVRKDREIYETLRRMAEVGVRATYHSCDVADWDALAEVLEQVRRTDGPIEGILHGAGYVKFARFDKTAPEQLSQTVAAKADGAAALMALTRQDPLRYFIGFGSISGRFGANGLSDYAAANDLLAKLVDWFRKERPDCASACVEWESWGEVGQAVRPQYSVGAKNVLNLEFMPPSEGIEHLEEEMRAGLPESEVLFSDGQFYRTFYPGDSALAAPEPAAPTWPLLEAAGSGEGGDRSVVEARFDPTGDPFLVEHRLRGRPILPAVIGLESLAEAGARATGVSPVRGEHGQDARATRIVVGLRDVEIVNGLVFRSDEPVTARLSATPAGNEVRCVLSCDFQDRKGRVVQRERPYFRGVVELASQPARIDALPTGEPPEEWYPNVYLEDREVFHGPVLRSLREYAHDSDGCWGKIVAPPAAELAGSRPDSGWILPAAVLDACLVCSANYLYLQKEGLVGLPHRFDRLRLGRWPRVGETCLLRVHFRQSEGIHEMFDFTLLGDDQTVIVQAEGYRVVRLPERVL